MRKLTKAQAAEIEEDKAFVRQLLDGQGKDHPVVYTNLKHVSRSGMLRHITVSAVADGDIVNITGRVGRILDYRLADDGGLKVGGCGMDMGFHVVYGLSRILYKGTETAAKAHNGDAGCVVRHEWMR